MPLPLGGPSSAEFDVTCLAKDPDDALRQVREMLAPGWDIAHYTFEVAYRGFTVGGGDMEIRVFGSLMRTSPPVPSGASFTHTFVPIDPDEESTVSVVDLEFNVHLSPRDIEDATTLGAFVDEVRGYISERMRHYKFHEAEPFTVNVNMPGYAPEVTGS